MKNNNSSLLKKIKLVVFDFDGVFTNNQVIIHQDGTESVACVRSDGLGLSMLRELKIQMLILSTEPNPVVSMRANKLKLECVQNCPDKLVKLKEICRTRKIDLKNVAYLGNDINDLPCLNVVGLPVCVADSYPSVIKACRMVLTRRGGQGAVREFCEKLSRQINKSF